jgi:uncharacterized protein (DUF58 family)
MKIGKTFWWVLSLALLTAGAAFRPGQGDNKIFLRLLITWVVIIVLGFLWTSFSLAGVRVHRHARILRQQVGQTFVERYDIINQSPIPKIWIKLLDQSEISTSEGSRMITYLRGRESRSFNTFSILKYRGMFNLGPTTITSGDVLGLFSISRKFEPDARLLVLPHMEEIKNFPAPFGILPGGRALRLKTTEVTPYSSGVREYISGDPLRRIHWPSSARKDKLIVKEFEKDPLAEVWIFLDASKNIHVETFIEDNKEGIGSIIWADRRRKFKLPPSTFEYSVCIAASIAKYYINQRREVGLSTCGSTHLIMPADRGERQMAKILDNLALLTSEGSMPLFMLVTSHLSSLIKGSTAIIITASGEEDVIMTCNSLLSHGISPVIILVDAGTFGGRTGAEELEERLINLNVLVFRIRNDTDIAKAFQSESIKPSRRILS